MCKSALPLSLVALAAIAAAGSSCVQTRSEVPTESISSAPAKLRIGLTDTLYAQIRFSLSALDVEPVELTTPETLKSLFLDAPRPAQLEGRSDAEIVNHVIATANNFSKKRWDVSIFKPLDGILDKYIEANRQKYATPSEEAFLAPVINMAFVRKQVAQLDGFVIGGGEDVNPRLYSAKDLQLPNAKGSIEENTYARTRDLIELAYIGEAVRQAKPVLGICRGSQILGVALGGKLVQDIPTEFPSLQKRHSMPEEFLRSEGHEVLVRGNSLFARIMDLGGSNAGTDARKVGDDFILGVNSYHHQAVFDEFPAIVVNARDHAPTTDTKNPVVEGFVAKGTAALVMGVQWHPERAFAVKGSSVAATDIPMPEWKQWFDNNPRRPYYQRIFENFVACAGNRRSCQR